MTSGAVADLEDKFRGSGKINFWTKDEHRVDLLEELSLEVNDNFVVVDVDAQLEFYYGELPLETLQDHKSRYISKLRSDVIEDWDCDFFSKSSAFTICLTSNNTGDFDYAFEFIWNKRPNYVIFLEALILTLKRCLPRFKFAFGVELGDELDVIVGETARYSEYGKTSHVGKTEKLKIFQGKRTLSSLEVISKTTPKTLPREVIEQQFEKTMKEAAIYLYVIVSLSTLKRKFKELGIPEWPGPNFAKRNVNDSSTIQVITNGQENGAIQDPSILNLNKNILTIKATLKYLDEDGDWISLTSDEDMSDCIKSSKTLDQVVVRLRVIPSCDTPTLSDVL
ncbi:hypothetical protein QVD17_39849 [Tagetes erecta]|uniref:PB1 domain-containing protein n=1 Tax=Tagetes erecta TaxID=13708 RepID=A0AAD8NFP8_TARER|nr:hypothetical protein QVD17_39849 [Tagetes erecta]